VADGATDGVHTRLRTLPASLSRCSGGQMSITGRCVNDRRACLLRASGQRCDGRWRSLGDRREKSVDLSEGHATVTRARRSTLGLGLQFEID